MKTKTKEVYYCEHCKKHGLVKNKMIYHEAICSKNPQNYRPCFNCEHLNKGIQEITNYDYLGREYIEKLTVFYCEEKLICLYPPKVEAKGNAFEIDDNHPMPKECELFEERRTY